ncbi:hypothetical protein DQ04_03631030 [Trypanosoma grayi]|uniref:hypothetical protein n=1 Tax=Trypanosoma grayi TaxID=71804 RepID=UPI0004F41EAF|nr:hypothetical protein DQ04_03631030 [Trypanosoma grayi]KEG10506.1 hypothetical protein DQ04_03631030 [Trypanosoma grayi]
MEDENELWSTAAVFRGTEEYAAAFNLEVWKAQQQSRMRSELGEEKARLQKTIAAEVRKREEQRLAELDAFRQELEQLARRLQLREDVLQRRTSQFEAREAVFEERRVKVAEQHERHLVALEDRTRRQLEEAVVQQDTLKAELRERDGRIVRLEERLRAAESEYDTLQRCMARTVADDEDKARASRLEEQLATANATLMGLQVQLKEREAELALTRKERDQLERASKLYKEQLGQLAQRYSDLQQQWHHRERVLLEDDRHRLEEAKRRHELAVRQAGSGAKGVHGYELLRQQVAENIAPRALRDAVSTRGGAGTEDDYHALLKELQGDVAKGLHELKGKGKKSTSKPSRQRLVYAEVAPRRHAEELPRKRHTDPAVATITTATVGGTQRKPHNVARATAPHDETITSTLSSLSQRESDGRRESTEPYTSPLEDRPLANEEAEVDMSSSYCYAEVESWATDGEEHRALPRDATSYLPPLVPTTSDIKLEFPPPPPLLPPPQQQQQQQPLPLPEDFVQASRAAPPPPSRDSTRAEMVAFVEKLQANKQKLLESGVYSESDTLLREMTDKIALYEDFLSKHF